MQWASTISHSWTNWKRRFAENAVKFSGEANHDFSLRSETIVPLLGFLFRRQRILGFDGGLGVAGGYSNSGIDACTLRRPFSVRYARATLRLGNWHRPRLVRSQLFVARTVCLPCRPLL